MTKVFEKDLSLSALFDLYAPLLNEKKQKAFVAYYCEDLSLSEVAELSGTSRQAVRDLLFRTASELKSFEEALGLMKKRRVLENALSAAEQCGSREEILKKIGEIKNLL